MSRAPAAKRQPQPLIPSPRDEAILKQFVKYRFLTAQEITRLCYSKASLTFARSRLSALCGNKAITDEDFTEGYPLLRMGFPTGKRGSNEYIFALSLTGRRMLERLGIPVSWHLRIPQLQTLSHSSILHDLTRNRLVVACHAWARTRINISIEYKLSNDLAKTPTLVEIPVKARMVKVGVIPDALILFTNTRTGRRHILVLEIDQNTQAPGRFRRHIASRLAYIKSSGFTKAYGTIPVLIVYVIQGVTDSASKARLKAMCKLTMRLLIDRKRPLDIKYFRFTTIKFKSLYDDSQSLFEKAVWYKPDDLKLERPVPLLTP
jgi:Replication-relaxation